MSTILDLKKKKKSNFGKKEIIVVVLAVVLTTVGIKASDNILSPDSNLATENNRCPDGMVFITSENGGFCIDKYEAAAGSECPYNDPNNQLDTRNNIDSPDCEPVSRKGNKPWRNISQNQAAMACAKAGKRLPTNKEWLQAALGTPDENSSWGSGDCQVDNNWEIQPGLTGTGENCKSAAGAYDMIGNIWEWVDGTVFNGAYKDKPLPDDGYIMAVDDSALPSKTGRGAGDPNYYEDYFWIKNKGTRSMARGGYWDNQSNAGQYALYVVLEPSFIGQGIGFRCAQ